MANLNIEKRNKKMVTFTMTPETIEKLEWLCRANIRDKGNMLEYLISKEYDAQKEKTP
jgi:hypothetical protein